MTHKTGIASYVALVDADMYLEDFINEEHYDIGGGEAETIVFGDGNFDNVINAQDALMVVDSWLRKGDEPTDDEILAFNVNGDSRINTFDALGIVERFINGGYHNVVVKAANLADNW